MTQSVWKKELIIAAALVGFGLLILPLAVYWVGRQAIGEYAADAGALDLAEHIWWDLLQLDLAAWLLVSSPYLLFQLVRWVRFCWRRTPL